MMNDIVKLDMNLIEKRLTTSEASLVDSPHTGRDLYREAAARYYQVGYDEVTQVQRLHAKRSLYHLMYDGKEYYTPEQIIAMGIEEMSITR